MLNKLSIFVIKTGNFLEELLKAVCICATFISLNIIPLIVIYYLITNSYFNAFVLAISELFFIYVNSVLNTKDTEEHILRNRR